MYNMPAKARKMYRKRALKKRVSRAKKVMANKDDHYVTVKASGNLRPVQGTTALSNYVWTAFSPCPSYLNPIQSMPIFSEAEFTLNRQMYDQFRVLSMTVKLIPRYTMADSTTLVGATDNNQITQGTGTFYSVVDRDGWGPGHVSALKKVSSCKTHSIYKPFSRTYRPNYTNNSWLDCQDPAGIFDYQRLQGIAGTITIFGASFPEKLNQQSNGIWADVEVSYRCVFRGKTLLNIQVADNGDVTLSQSAPLDLEAPMTATPASKATYTGAVDLSGLIIE